MQGPGGPGCSWAISNKDGACSFCSLQNIQVKNNLSLDEYLENEKEIQTKLTPDRIFDVANQFLPTLNSREKIKWLKEYIRIRNSKGINSKKYAYLTVSSIDDEIAPLLKEAGISEVYLGIDHFNEKALSYENKPFRKRKTLKKCLDALKKQKIKFRAGIVLGSASEDLETLESVRSGIKWLIENYKDIINAIGIFPVEIIPGSKDFEKMKKSGVLHELFTKFEEFGFLTREEQRLMTSAWINKNSNISETEIHKFKKEMFNYMKREGVFSYGVDKK